MAKEIFRLIVNQGIKDMLDDNFKQYMHEEFYKLMFPYIPFNTGELSSTTDFDLYIDIFSDEEVMNLALNSGNITPEGITFNAPYAEKVYYSDRSFNPEKHPLAISKWGEVTMNLHEQELINRLQEYADRRNIEI